MLCPSVSPDFSLFSSGLSSKFEEIAQASFTVIATTDSASPDNHIREFPLTALEFSSYTSPLLYESFLDLGCCNQPHELLGFLAMKIPVFVSCPTSLSPFDGLSNWLKRYYEAGPGKPPRRNELGTGRTPAPEPLIQDGKSVHTLAATQATIVACECNRPKSLSGQLVPPGRLEPVVKSWPKIFVRGI